jgi:hypothetical protein
VSHEKGLDTGRDVDVVGTDVSLSGKEGYRREQAS